MKIDPCVVWPDNVGMCSAFPLNQPGKPEYDRPVNPMDVCVTADEYAELQKHFRELLRRCGDRCDYKAPKISTSFEQVGQKWEQ